MSFTPEELAAEIQKAGYDLEISYNPDFRQRIADSWPASLDDSKARQDWGWKEEYDLAKLTRDMLTELSKTVKRGGSNMTQ
jgi:nucleoside-diphosphate-sugar epimerase